MIENIKKPDKTGKCFFCMCFDKRKRECVHADKWMNDEWFIDPNSEFIINTCARFILTKKIQDRERL